MNKTLICYFSASGVTKKVAENLAKTIEGDLFEIEPQEKYTSADLDWTNNESRTSIEMQDKSSRPIITKKIENLDQYTKVVIGFPVWWYTVPTIVNTFIEENDLSNKQIYVFITSGGTSETGSFNDLKNTYPNLNFVSARRFTGDETLDEYRSFIEE